MKETFVDIIRLPDDVKIQTETSPLRYEEAGVENPVRAEVKFTVEDGVLGVWLYPNGDAVRSVRLRFDGDLSGVVAVLGDAVERCGPGDAVWHAMNPHQRLPWYFFTNDGECLHSYGVKTGGNSIAFWYTDPFGITLLLDTGNGAGGTVAEELLCGEVICQRGNAGVDPYLTARAFCGRMCDAPKLPDLPVYGFNNWYWAYGDTDERTVLREAGYLGALTADLPVWPFMMIDDGWQVSHVRGYYNGGPWSRSNEQFVSMQRTAEQIHATGCRAGIWMRPLLTISHVPSEAVYDSHAQKTGIVLDPSHPFSKEKIAEDIRRIRGWGYELIKHDFTCYDLFGEELCGEMPEHFYDRTKTNAQILRELYALIQEAAGEDALILGCNTVGHLVAGIHPLQRIGNDTSGRSFEWTRRYGIHSMMRMTQNKAFYIADPDCAAFTGQVSEKLNFEFLNAAAMTGAAVFASVTPGILQMAGEQRLHDIFQTACSVGPDEGAVITDWLYTAVPSGFSFRGKEYRYNWYEEYRGARHDLTWLA